MSAGMTLEVHDQNNNYSADRKKDGSVRGHFFTMMVAANFDVRRFRSLFEIKTGWRVQFGTLDLEPFILNPVGASGIPMNILLCGLIFRFYLIRINQQYVKGYCTARSICLPCPISV